ncbi:hypothetical protein [Thiolapillus sp.]
MKKMFVVASLWLVFVIGAIPVHAGGIKAIIDLDSGRTIAGDASANECSKRCIEIYSLGEQDVLILHDDNGNISSRVVSALLLDDPYEPFLSHGEETRTVMIDEPRGGTCGAVKANCVEIIYLPDGSYVIIEYNPDGTIKKWDHYPKPQLK